MIFGNPFKFALLVEPVQEWCNASFTEGLFYFCINGILLPTNCFTVATTLNSDLHSYRNFLTAWKQPPQNHELFNANKDEVFVNLMMNLYPLKIDEDFDYPEEFIEDYSYYLSPNQMESSGIYCFIINKDNLSRIIIGIQLDGAQTVKTRFEVHDVILGHEEIVKIYSEMLESIASYSNP